MSDGVVITGTGIICGLGRDPQTAALAVREGRSAIAPIRAWDSAGWPHRYAAEIEDLDPRELVTDRKVLKLLRRSHVLGLYAGLQATEQAGFLRQRAEPNADVAVFNDRSGVYVGSGGGAFQDQYDYLPALARGSGDMARFGAELATVHPMWLLQTLPNNVLCHLGIQTGFTGPHACFVTHSISGLLALAEAAAALREGLADRAVAVAHDAPIEPQAVQGFAGLGVLAVDSVRPFDRRRDGTLLGEGAAALACERTEVAAARGARVLGEVLGSAAVSEGGALLGVRDDGDGLARAIALALDDAGCVAGDVGMIVAHGNGTRPSDASEALAIMRVFDGGVPPVTSFKWAVGHTLAAAGLIDTVLALEALRGGIVPGIATLREVDPACVPLPVSRHAQSPRSDVALLLNRGFAGTNAAVLVRASAS
jgi:3-oxoacyl-(acyl-carrier-protein) synthase